MSPPDLLFESIRYCFIRTAIEHVDGAINRFEVFLLVLNKNVGHFQNVQAYIDYSSFLSHPSICIDS